MAVTIKQLENELIARAKTLPAFKSNSYSVYSLDDLAAQSELQAFPILGVGYNGTYPNDGNQGQSASRGSNSAILVDMQLVVMIGVQYQFAGQENTKYVATDLLDQLRSAILGFVGVNNRPWRFIGERPEQDASMDGVIFYSQVWHTAVPVIGSFTQ